MCVKCVYAFIKHELNIAKYLVCVNPLDTKMVNIFMRDAYANAFYELVRDTQEVMGYELPIDLEAYVVMLLGNYIDRPNFLPTSSFAESLLSLNYSQKTQAKELGDVCLFVSGVFPEYGMKKRYYSTIGKSSYAILHGEVFIKLTAHFDFLTEFIDVSINDKRTKDLFNF